MNLNGWFPLSCSIFRSFVRNKLCDLQSRPFTIKWHRIQLILAQKQIKRWVGSNMHIGMSYIVFYHVNFSYFHSSIEFVVCGELLHHGLHGLAEPAPRRSEVHEEVRVVVVHHPIR